MRTTTFILTLLMLLAAALPAVAGPSEKLLPEDTVLLLTVPNKAESAARLKAHPVHDMWMEEAVQKFLEKPKAKFEELISKAQEETGGVNPLDFFNLAEGEIALAITGLRDVSKGTAWLGMVVLVEYGGNEAKVREMLKVVEPKLFELDDHRRVEEDFRGTTLVSYPPKEGDPAAEGRGVQPGVACWFFDNGLFVLASDPDVLKGILVRRADPEAPCLAGNAHYRSVLNRMEGLGDFGMFANLDAVWTNVEGALKSLGGGPQGAMVLGIMKTIGLREPQALGMNMKYLPGGSSSAIYVKSPRPRTGIMKLMDGPNSGLMPPRFVPEDVAQVMTMAFDMQEMWKEARRLMDEFQPGMTGMVDQQIAMLKEQMGVDLEKDFLGAMGKTVTVYQFAPLPPPPDAPIPTPQQRMVLAIETSNAAKMQQSLDILLAMAGGGTGMPPSDEEYLGVKIKSFDLGVMQPTFAVAGDHLILATLKDDMKALIRTLGKEDAKTLVDSEAFARAMEGLPRMRSLVAYADPRKTMDSVGEQLGMVGMFLPGFTDWIDPSLWPGEVIKKYLDVGGSVMVNEEEGLFLLSFSRMQRPKKSDK